MLLRASLGLTCLVLLTSFVAADDNWPRFRGPNGTGVADAKTIPPQWTDKDVLWKAPVPGVGNGSPIVWGDKMFLQSATEDGSKRMLVGLSAADGKVLWTADLPGNPVKFRKDSSYANSTPCTDGERVYALVWDGQTEAIHAYDFAGKPLWKRDLGKFDSQHGSGASPIVHEGKVYLNHDMDNKASVIALNAKSGEVAWQKERKAFRTCYSTPFLLDKTDEGSELVVASTAGLTSYNPQTGKENWNWSWPFTGMALRTVGGALIHQGMAFAISGDGTGARSMVAVKLGGSGELPRESLAWRMDKDTPYVPCLLAQGDYVYGIHDSGKGLCLDAKSGKVVWNERVCGQIYASPLLINGHIYAVDSAGEVAVYPASPTFKSPLTSSVGEPVQATPAVANGKLFIRGRTTLYCIGKK